MKPIDELRNEAKRIDDANRAKDYLPSRAAELKHNADKCYFEKRDAKAAFNLYKEAADKGNKESWEILGRMYLKGDGCHQSEYLSYAHLKRYSPTLPEVARHEEYITVVKNTLDEKDEKRVHDALDKIYQKNSGKITLESSCDEYRFSPWLYAATTGNTVALAWFFSKLDISTIISDQVFMKNLFSPDQAYEDGQIWESQRVKIEMFFKRYFFSVKHIPYDSNLVSIYRYSSDFKFEYKPCKQFPLDAYLNVLPLIIQSKNTYALDCFARWASSIKVKFIAEDSSSNRTAGRYRLQEPSGAMSESFISTPRDYLNFENHVERIIVINEWLRVIRLVKQDYSLYLHLMRNLDFNKYIDDLDDSHSLVNSPLRDELLLQQQALLKIQIEDPSKELDIAAAIAPQKLAFIDINAFWSLVIHAWNTNKISLEKIKRIHNHLILWYGKKIAQFSPLNEIVSSCADIPPTALSVQDEKHSKPTSSSASKNKTVRFAMFATTDKGDWIPLDEKTCVGPKCYKTY